MSKKFIINYLYMIILYANNIYGGENVNKKVFAAIAVLSLLFVGLQFAEAVTAQSPANVINANSANGKVKSILVIQTLGPDHVKIIKKTFIRANSRSPWHLSITSTKYLDKINKKTLKITVINPPFTKLVKTPLTALQNI